MKPIFLFMILSAVFAKSFAQISDEQLTLHTATGDLKGTLIFPSAEKKFDLLVLQAGSGPTDRNGNSPLGVKGRSYRMLAEALASRGIATLLMDKRGIAASALAGKSEDNLRFDDYINDLVAWIEQLRKDKRVKKVYIAGHSEGALVAMLAAQQVKNEGYISIAGQGQPIDKIISWQLKQQAPKWAAVCDSLFERLKNNKKIDSVPPVLFSVLRPSVQPYMASWIKYDPCAEIKKLNGNILLLQGSTDIQVEQSEALHLKECNTVAQLAIISNMNHVLKIAPPERAANLKTYTDETLPIAGALVDEISSFIEKNR